MTGQHWWHYYFLVCINKCSLITTQAWLLIKQQSILFNMKNQRWMIHGFVCDSLLKSIKYKVMAAFKHLVLDFHGNTYSECAWLSVKIHLLNSAILHTGAANILIPFKSKSIIHGLGKTMDNAVYWSSNLRTLYAPFQINLHIKLCYQSFTLQDKCDFID